MLLNRRTALAMGAGLAFGGVARAAANVVETPFRVTRNRPWAAVTVNGKEPLAFLIDTGATNFHVTPQAVKTLGLTALTTTQVQASVGRFKTEVYRAGTVVIGSGVRERDVYMAGMQPGNYDLISGVIPIAKFGVMGLDFDRQQLLMATALDGDPEGYDFVPTLARGETKGMTNWLGAYSRDPKHMAELDHRPVIRGTLDRRPINLLLDTGATMSLFLAPDYVRRHNLWDSFAKSTEAAVQTSARSAHVRIARAGRLEFGPIAFENPIVTLGNPADSDEDGADNIDGVIGFELLRRLNFLNHPGRKRLYYKPSQALHDVYRYDRAGIEIDAVDGALRVVWVAAGGAAARAGLVVGDKVTGWRGKDGYYGLLWALTGAAGTKVEIQVERGGAQTLIPVELKERI